MDTHELPQWNPKSHLFTVRVWMEEFDDGQSEVRMQAKHILSGETRYFRDWALLVTYLLVKLQENDFASMQDDQSK